MHRFDKRKLFTCTHFTYMCVITTYQPQMGYQHVPEFLKLYGEQHEFDHRKFICLPMHACMCVCVCVSITVCPSFLSFMVSIKRAWFWVLNPNGQDWISSFLKIETKVSSKFIVWFCCHKSWYTYTHLHMLIYRPRTSRQAASRSDWRKHACDSPLQRLWQP